jgi:hypothetical protein
MFEVFNQLKRVVLGRLVVSVPADVAECEFDCRETVCSRERWEACGRRRATKEQVEGVFPCGR